MKVKQLQQLLEHTAVLLEEDGKMERALCLRAFADAIAPMGSHSVEALIPLLSAEVKLDVNGK
jgi:hypothetical protein